MRNYPLSHLVFAPKSFFLPKNLFKEFSFVCRCGVGFALRFRRCSRLYAPRVVFAACCPFLCVPDPLAFIGSFFYGVQPSQHVVCVWRFLSSLAPPPCVPLRFSVPRRWIVGRPSRKDFCPVAVSFSFRHFPGFERYCSLITLPNPGLVPSVVQSPPLAHVSYARSRSFGATLGSVSLSIFFFYTCFNTCPPSCWYCSSFSGWAAISPYQPFLGYRRCLVDVWHFP